MDSVIKRREVYPLAVDVQVAIRKLVDVAAGNEFYEVAPRTQDNAQLFQRFQIDVPMTDDVCQNLETFRRLCQDIEQSFFREEKAVSGSLLSS